MSTAESWNQLSLRYAVSTGSTSSKSSQLSPRASSNPHALLPGPHKSLPGPRSNPVESSHTTCVLRSAARLSCNSCGCPASSRCSTSVLRPNIRRAVYPSSKLSSRLADALLGSRRIRCESSNSALSCSHTCTNELRARPPPARGALAARHSPWSSCVYLHPRASEAVSH